MLADAGLRVPPVRGPASAGRRRCCWSRPRSRPLLLVVPLVALVAAHRLGRRCPTQLALRAAARGAVALAGRPPPPRSLSAWCSGCRWPGCWRGSTSAAAALLRALVTVPLVLPPVVAGVALRTRFGRNG